MANVTNLVTVLSHDRRKLLVMATCLVSPFLLSGAYTCIHHVCKKSEHGLIGPSFIGLFIFFFTMATIDHAALLEVDCGFGTHLSNRVYSASALNSAQSLASIMM